MEILQNVVAFSEYMNFTTFGFSQRIRETCPVSANLLDSLIALLVSPYAIFGFCNFYSFNMKSRVVAILVINHFPRLFTYVLKIGYFLVFIWPKIILAILFEILKN